MQTALSQEHNLYFVAHGPDIYVYEPEFPEQTLHAPVLIVPSQPSSPDLRGYIDRDEPHAINYLIVQNLGKDEVIANVRDDGDVEVFLVRHISHAIATLVNRHDISKHPVADNVKPLFLRNVGISAWGLAIHTEARIIAVSSNRHEVTIFRFGLVDEYDEIQTPRKQAKSTDDGHSSRWDEERREDNVDSRPERKTDVTRQVLNGEANIPHIAFCNTGDDPDGRWLLTTDISGVCRAIDLHTFALVQAFRFGPSFIAPNGGLYDRMNAGWGIMFLDTRSFISQDSILDALGMEDSEMLPDAKSDSRLWDLSKTLRHLPDNSKAFKAAKVEVPQSTAPPSATERSSNASSPQLSGTADIVLTVGLSSDNDDDIDDTGVLLEPSTLSPTEDSTLDDAQEDDSEHDVELWSDLDDSEGENTEDVISQSAYYGGGRICGNMPHFVRQSNLCEGLPCPVLHTSIRNVYLLQPSKQRLSPNQPFMPPMVGMAAPLKQSIQVEYRALNMFDRLSMHAYIPALGVVVLASQKGRAIVLSLSRVPQSMEYPEGIDPSLGQKTVYTLRPECILPFESQEKAGQRPFSPLHGIAVGPIQGTENGKNGGKVRWRLIMMYQDYSTLSYELRRTQGAELGVGDFVV
ncbi:hypothetical protein MBLNU13_g11137t1 [Cladosporium sp. NU13]